MIKNGCCPRFLCLCIPSCLCAFVANPFHFPQDIAAEAMGINTTKLKLFAFSLSTVFAGIICYLHDREITDIR
ncbi:MAG: hypothetical protein ABH886_00685 [Candidatus Desantisbacteria bacterium]